jgi:hypothetical protein
VAEYLGLTVHMLGWMLVPVAVAWLFSIAPVPRSRVARIARRQRLTVTPDNGDQVIRYLATTRRWRAGGLVVAFHLFLVVPMVIDSWWFLDASIAVQQVVDHPGQPVLMFLSGWFVGAVIAEARLAKVRFGSRRAASLAPRDAHHYLGRAARAALPLAAVACLAVTAAGAVRAAGGAPIDLPRFLAWTAVALAVAATVWTVQRQVLARPQPVLPPDQLAADDAIRSRSLHVLAGSGAALIGYAVIGQLAALWAAAPGAPRAYPLLGILTIVVPLLGWHVATLRWSVTRQPVPVRAAS